MLGYVDLEGTFKPGPVLNSAKQAIEAPSLHLTCILDEMNLARVEQYFAEALSCIEDRRPAANGGFESPPLIPDAPGNGAFETVNLPPNFGIVGTVNMDESAHGFSRKVLDRAFTLELSEIDLSQWEGTSTVRAATAATWPIAAWHPRGVMLSRLDRVTEEHRLVITRVLDSLDQVNRFLTQAQLQLGYRTRDELTFFVLHSNEILSSFITRAGEKVDPLDLGLHMKVLPRIIGGSGAVRRAIIELLGWAWNGHALVSEEDAQPLVTEWERIGRPNSVPAANYPRTTARLCLMWERVIAEGFTSFWL